MKNLATADELFKSLTFGIRRSRILQKKDDAVDNVKRMRILPDDYKEESGRTKGVNCEGPSDLAVSVGVGQLLEPKILEGFETVVKTKRKERHKTMAAKREQVAHLRRLNHIYVWGGDIPDPLIHFADICGSSQELLNNLDEFGIVEPTPIQMQAIPLMMQNRDVLCSAPTGSGKTLAFALPIIVDIIRLKNYPSDKSSRLHAVVLEPTRELAKQTCVQFQKFAQNLSVTCAFLDGSELPKDGSTNTSVSAVLSLSSAIQVMTCHLHSKLVFAANVIVSTPNKLVYALGNSQKKLASNKLRWLVVDESDRLFDTTEGDQKCFRSQLAKIYQACSGNAVRRAFFSATFSHEVEEWCKKNLYDVAMICIGARNAAVDTVKQELIFAGSEHGKVIALRSLFQSSFDPPALIFVQSKLRARQLVSAIELFQPPVSVSLISSERTEMERESAIAKFRSGEVWVLVCTDLMGRGLDLSGVNLVINFDLPTSVINYIHRIGRTGRAGRRGHAVTYFTEDDLNYIRPIANVIRQAGFEVPEYVLKMRIPTREEKKKLMKRAPRRKNIGASKKKNRKNIPE